MKSALGIGFFVVIIGLVVGLYIRRRNMSFEGTVTDKDLREEKINTPNQTPQTGISINNSGVKHIYTIKVQTQGGKQISWQVSEGKYQIINIGDRVSKHSGTTDIDVIAQASTAAASSPPPPTTPTQT